MMSSGDDEGGVDDFSLLDRFFFVIYFQEAVKKEQFHVCEGIERKPTGEAEHKYVFGSGAVCASDSCRTCHTRQ